MEIDGDQWPWPWPTNCVCTTVVHCVRQMHFPICSVACNSVGKMSQILIFLMKIVFLHNLEKQAGFINFGGSHHLPYVNWDDTLLSITHSCYTLPYYTAILYHFVILLYCFPAILYHFAILLFFTIHHSLLPYSTILYCYTAFLLYYTPLPYCYSLLSTSVSLTTALLLCYYIAIPHHYATLCIILYYLSTPFPLPWSFVFSGDHSAWLESFFANIWKLY